jgi:hypothetical protein
VAKNDGWEKYLDARFWRWCIVNRRLHINPFSIPIFIISVSTPVMPAAMSIIAIVIIPAASMLVATVVIPSPPTAIAVIAVGWRYINAADHCG